MSEKRTFDMKRTISTISRNMVNTVIRMLCDGYNT